MDIEILLWFQSFRELTSSWLSSFFTFITTIAVDYYILVPALIIFWVIDKKRGSRILLSWGTSLGIGAFLKSTFCVYRPWVRDERITPPKEIIDSASGYSFPSGHSFSAGGFWNGIIFTFNKYKSLIIFSVSMVLLTMFSRLYFTVHTPQDVLTGGLVSLLIAFGISKLSIWVNEKDNRDIIVLVVATVLVIALLCYLALKSYPLDYVDGVLLVDPKKMTVDGFKDPGRFYGIVVGWFIERRFVKFKVEGSTFQKVMRALVGGILVVFYWTAIASPLGKMIDVGVAHFLLQASIPIIFMTIYPWLFNKIESHKNSTNKS